MRFVPRGFVHLSGLISFNEDIERLSVDSPGRSRHTPLGIRRGFALRATAGSWSDIRGRITRTMAEDLALTCSIVFAGRTTVLRSLLGQRVSRVRECRCCRGSAS